MKRRYITLILVISAICWTVSCRASRSPRKNDPSRSAALESTLRIASSSMGGRRDGGRLPMGGPVMPVFVAGAGLAEKTSREGAGGGAGAGAVAADAAADDDDDVC